MDKRALSSTFPCTVLEIFLVILIQLLQWLTKLALKTSTRVSFGGPIRATFAMPRCNRYRMNLSRFLKSGQKLSSSWIKGIKRSCKRFLYIQREYWQMLSMVTETKVLGELLSHPF